MKMIAVNPIWMKAKITQSCVENFASQLGFCGDWLLGCGFEASTVLGSSESGWAAEFDRISDDSVWVSTDGDAWSNLVCDASVTIE